MIKVGDKIRVTTDDYSECPRGTICTVTRDHADGNINLTIDGGDGLEWYFLEGEYEPLTFTETTPEKLTVSKLFVDDKGPHVILSNGSEISGLVGYEVETGHHGRQSIRLTLSRQIAEVIG